MLDVEGFDAVFQGLHYSNGLVQQIQEYQHALGGRTFFERLLELLKITGKSYADLGTEPARLTISAQARSCTLPGTHSSCKNSTSASSRRTRHYIISIASSSTY